MHIYSLHDIGSGGWPPGETPVNIDAVGKYVPAPVVCGGSVECPLHLCGLALYFFKEAERHFTAFGYMYNSRRVPFRAPVPICRKLYSAGETVLCTSTRTQIFFFLAAS